MRIGYSYTRYSSPAQSDGDSIRRQTTNTAAWCKRHGVSLDESRSYLDRGRSAYHGRHRKDGGALKVFLDDVERGDIPSGSVLIIENLDRLSRENPWDAIPLLCGIVNHGVTVAALSPSEMLFERGSDMTALILAVVEFSRGHSESASKANRMGAVWGEKRRTMREQGTILTRQLPAWIEERKGKLVVIPARARVVHRMFDLAIKGYGLGLIVKGLTEAGEPVWGRSNNGWSKSYVHKILSGRVVLGEYQPISQGKPDGEPLPDYYPALVDESTWFRAQAALERRKDKPGPIGAKVATLFGGLLRDAASGDRLRIAWQTRGVKGKRIKRRVLVTASSMEGQAPSVSFPHDIFEPAVLSLLKEINPADILAEKLENKSIALIAELADKEQRARLVEDELASGDDVPALARVLRKLSEECDSLRKQLAVARQEESGSSGIAWSEAMTLVDAAQTEGARLRLRELLRTIVEEIVILIVPRRSHRLAALQIYFRGGRRRDYLIHYQAAGHCREGGWCARSLPNEIRSGNLDLRRKHDVQRLTETLAKIDVKRLAIAMATGIVRR
jgi:DNA invertase Pin-like site-specific DNA recombinase